MQNKKTLLISTLALATIAQGSLNANPTADKLAVQWQLVDHTVKPAEYHLSRLTLENKDRTFLENKGWKLYFTFVRRPLAALPVANPLHEVGRKALEAQGIKISHADAAKSGDYFVLEPLANFEPIAPGQKRSFDILVELWALLKSDQPAGFHLSVDGGPAKAVMATIVMDPKDPKQTQVFDGDVRPYQTSKLRYEENLAIQANQPLSLADTLLPRPLKVDVRRGEVTVSAAGLAVQYTPILQNEAEIASKAISDATNTPVALLPGQARPGNGRVTLALNPALDVDGDGRVDSEGYALTIDPQKGITITGADPSGVFYGIQTLRQLIPVHCYQAAAAGQATPSFNLPVVTIQDAPLFSYRGMMLDTARHFQTKETVYKLLDRLAYLKINKFHLRLADDEGWRLETPGIPELTEFGGRRGFDPNEVSMLHAGMGSSNDLAAGDGILGKPRTRKAANHGVTPTWQGYEQASANFVGKGSGYYTTKDFEDILRYAMRRHIQVIPEFDFPGHARAAVQAMEYRFRKYEATNPQEAWRYRLLDPKDTSAHTSVQSYTDNFANPAMESTYTFLDKVVREVKARYDAVGAYLPAIHAGGDELPSLSGNVWWQGSPAVKNNPVTKNMDDRQLADYFFSRWYQIITNAGTACTGWSDVLTNGTGNLSLPGFIPMPWSNVWGWGSEQQAYQFANRGQKVILAHATNLYMDLAYNKDQNEPGYYWANFVDEKKTFEYRPFNVYANATHNRWGGAFTPDPTWEKLTETGKQNILGLQGLLWAENMKTEELMEYATFPKILGVAERAWNRNMAPESEMTAAWSTFCNTLGKSILPRLDHYKVLDLEGAFAAGSQGVNYRIPLPGGIIKNGYLLANVRNPGLKIQYSVNNGATWRTYAQPVKVTGKVLLRTQNTAGKNSRVAEVE